MRRKKKIIQMKMRKLSLINQQNEEENQLEQNPLSETIDSNYLNIKERYVVVKHAKTEMIERNNNKKIEQNQSR